MSEDFRSVFWDDLEDALEAWRASHDTWLMRLINPKQREWHNRRLRGGDVT